MVKLSAIKTKNIKALIYGNPGTGKTCFAAGFPGPIMYLDFDNKVNSAARFYSEDKERLEQIDVEVLSASLSVRPMDLLNAKIDMLRKMQATGEYPYKTLVVDSITTFSSAMLGHIIQSNPGVKGRVTAQGTMPDKPHYGILLREFERVIGGLLTLDMNVLMLGHITVYKNEATGEMIREVMMDGSFSEKIVGYFDEAWVSFVDDKGRYMLQTKSDSKFKCTTQLRGLPNPCEMKYEEIAKFIK